jgi:hypothetical protein
MKKSVRGGHRAAVTAAFLIAAALLAAACSPWNIGHYKIEERSYGSPDAGERVLIAAQGSEFKEQVVAGVVERLQARDVFVRLIPARELGEADAADWDAVLVVYAMQAASEQRQARRFLESTPHRERVVALRTQGGKEEWPGERSDIDAITSASQRERVQPVVEQVSARLFEILGLSDVGG